MSSTFSIRQQAAQQFAELIDTAFFNALCEPVRIQILSKLIELGPADISTLAEHFSQDRSVISRHLSLLEESGIVSSTREGRHRYYEVNGKSILTMLDNLSQQVRRVVNCCAC
ncbi:helix-turn-helix transcriptional regulator [Undibacterium sp.]|uniref:ArsR/SmtB family transcription factor n=1 Tax=Undibacterium sp. TaxID=1914977 RepID=UPI002730BC54|nr:metalloregulator ArsR/SmtB family transcription factor [Undibacterium sp.]MDP1979594.1 metalloregulator ArsR/SmtB family transcription factor [Undibacterium sp.]